MNCELLLFVVLGGRMATQGGISVSAQNVSRTGINSRQTEQLYEKMTIPKRQMVYELFQELSKDQLSQHITSSKPAVPPQWYIQCLDSWRYVAFEWPSIHFQCLPEQKNQEDLFTLCMSVLEHLSLPICYLTNRYEFLRKSGGQVISVHIPIFCLSEFVRVHKLQGDNGSHFHNLRALWKENNIAESLFRQMALMIFKFRQHGAVPFILIHSSLDKHSLWICFRDYSLIIGDLWLKGLLQIVESDNERVPPNTPLKTCQFVDWPILEHSGDVDPPQYLCQSKRCLKGNDQMVHDSIRSKFKDHKGPREKRCAAFVKKQMGNIWHEKYEPLFVEERAAVIKEKGVEGDKEKENEIQNMLLEKYEELASANEGEFEKQWRDENYAVKMRRCSGCKQVYYCSSECQKEDWKNHKIICKTFGEIK